MKKNSVKVQKLTLNRETVHHLNAPELTDAVGGRPNPPSGPSVCISWCWTC